MASVLHYAAQCPFQDQLPLYTPGDFHFRIFTGCDKNQTFHAKAGLRVAFKTDDSFLEKLTMGALGSRAVAAYLDARGHHVAELERYTTANKIWATKVKRLRLPDLFCLHCGLRIEARAKSKLEIKLSDSPTVPGREWDANLRDEDLIGLVKCFVHDGNVRPSSRVELFEVGALRTSADRSRLGPPKSASEGAERDRTWPANVPPRNGRVETIESDRVRVEWKDGGRYSYRLTDEKPHAYLEVDEEFAGQEQFIIGSVEVPTNIGCPGSSWIPSDDLTSERATDRYAAVKALGLAGDPSVSRTLREIALSEEQDIRIRVEALGALARLGNASAIGELAEIALSDELAEGMPMEAVFILSELTAHDAADALERITMNTDLDEELRAAAAWGLGATGHNQPDRLFHLLGDSNDYVAVHAVVAAGKAVDDQTCRLAGELLSGSSREAAAASRLLANQGALGARVLAEVAQGGTGSERVWALRGLGLAGRKAIEEIDLPADTLHLLEPMLAAEDSFIDDEDVLKLLHFVEKQVNFNPLV